MKIEFAEPEDHAELLVLTRNSALLHVRDFSNKFMSGPEAYAKKRILVIRHRKVIVAFVLVNHRVMRGGYSNISFIGTHPVHRRKGYAKALVERVLKDSPWGKLCAHVSDQNPEALSWYLRTGWSAVGEGRWKTKGKYVIVEKRA